MSKKLLLFLLFFLVLRVLLFNVNISEWGDSYHIVRAAESLRENFSYPVDEKRLPLFSVLIALNPLPVEMMVWAKILQVFLTLGILFLTYKLSRRFFPTLSEDYCLMTIAYCLFSPVFLYWSIRVVGGVLLTFLVLLAFEIYYEGAPRARSYHGRWAAGLGVVCGLAALTRYEGFLLAGAFGLAFLLAKKVKPLILYLSFFILVVSPWFIRNFLVFGSPLHSTYFSEPSTYTYNLKTVLIFVTSLVFLFGFTPAFYFIARGVRRVAAGPWLVNNGQHKVLQLQHLPLLIFIVLELLLILFWPAAVPRLFLPLIPFFTIFLFGDLNSVAAGPWPARRRWFAVTLGLTALCVLFQYFLRLHFLVLSKTGLVIIACLGFSSALVWLFFDLEKAKKVFLGLFLASEIVASFVVINNHRLIYSDALRAAQFATSLEGLTGYSDETGVVKYYLGERGRKLPDDFTEPKQQWGWLQDNQIDYVLATDEYEQLSRFNVFGSADYADKFTLVKKWEVTAADAFDSWLMQKRVFSQREYPVKHSWVYEVLR